jgi:tetratricopeptide (TPR) repeat protein
MLLRFLLPSLLSSVTAIDDVPLLAFRLSTGFPQPRAVFFTAHRDSPAHRFVSQAALHTRNGRLEDAALAYEHALSAYSLGVDEEASLYLALGGVYASLSRTAPAERALRSVLGSERAAALAHCALGSLYAREGRFSEAVQELEVALALRPGWFLASHNLGSVLVIRGDTGAGIAAWEAALRSLEAEGVDLAEAAAVEEARRDGKPLGSVPAGPAAVARLEKHLIAHILAVFQMPRSGEPPGGGGGGGAPAGALTEEDAERAEELRVGASLWGFLHRLQTLDLASFHRGIGFKLLDEGAFEDGLRHLHTALSLAPEPMGQLSLVTALALPLVYSSAGEVWAARSRVVRNVREALEDRGSTVHPERLPDLYHLMYQLPYSGLPAHLLMRDISAWVATCEDPVLPWVAPALLPPPAAAAAAAPPSPPPPLPRAPPPSAQVRVGIVSYQGFDCAVGHLLHNLVRALRGFSPPPPAAPRDGARVVDAPSRGAGAAPTPLTLHGGNGSSGAWEGWDGLGGGGGGGGSRAPRLPGVAGFHVTYFHLYHWADTVTQWIHAAVGGAPHFVARKSVTGSAPALTLDALRGAVAAAGVDVLLVADPGLNVDLYALLFSRVAPVQVALWGSETAAALTLGLPDSVDYVVVGDGVTPRDAQGQLLEQAVRLGDVGTYLFAAPPLNGSDVLRAVASQGLLEGTRLYLVPCALHALHPAFDDVLLGVLAADPRGEVLLLYEEGQSLWLAKLRRRLAAHALAAPAALARLRFREEPAGTVGAPSPPSRRALMAAAEVVLDPFPVGLGTTALEALLGGTPVVSCPALQSALRRTAEGALRRLGLGQELLAAGGEDFVARAVRVASDGALRGRLAAALRARAPLLVWSDDVLAAHKRRSASGNVSAAWPPPPPPADAADTAWLAAQRAAGADDAAAGTLRDWVAFLGRAGAPAAVAREAAAAARGGGVRAVERRGARRGSSAPEAGRAGGAAGAGGGAAGGEGASGAKRRPRRRRAA